MLCQQFRSEIITDCILQEIQFDEFNSLKFQTISSGRIYAVTQELTVDGNTRTVESYRFKYFSDSIAVEDQNDPFSLYPYLSVSLANDKPVQVARYFSSSGVRLIHEIDYSVQNKVRIDLTREVSTGEIFYEGYADYFMDNDGNVTRNERFAADRGDTSQFVKIEDRFYRYDTYSSPQQNLYLPFFSNRNFPDVKFFSTNNILSFTEDEQTFQFKYEYGEHENMISQTLPGGQLVFSNM